MQKCIILNVNQFYTISRREHYSHQIMINNNIIGQNYFKVSMVSLKYFYYALKMYIYYFKIITYNLKVSTYNFKVITFYGDKVIIYNLIGIA